MAVGRLGLAGDEQADKDNHGGPDQAVYVYAREDMDVWAARLGREPRDGRFGENLTVRGVDVSEALIGERWRVGDVLLELTAARIPCVIFRGWMEEERWVQRFTREGWPGAYARALSAIGDRASRTILDQMNGEVRHLRPPMVVNADLVPRTGISSCRARDASWLMRIPAR